jgi:hypothetical protein
MATLQERYEECEREIIERSKAMHNLIKVSQSVLYLSEHGSSSVQWALRGIAEDARLALEKAGNLNA